MFVLRHRLVLGLAVLCIGASLAGCTSSKTAAKDVSITSCKAGPNNGHPTAQGSIHNKSSDASGYLIHVKFKDSSGNGVGDGAATVAKVEPDATAKWRLTGTLNVKGPVNCELGTVKRTAVP